MSDHPTRLLTYEDFAAYPDDLVRREIIGGEMFVTPSPIVRHQDIVLFLATAFSNHIRAHGGGRVFIAPLDVLLSEHDIVEPDVVYVATDRLDIVKEKHLVGAPSLLIEVVSDSRTDRVRKRALYARAGVPEYWIADPDADWVETYRLQDGVYGKPAIAVPGEILRTDLLPGLAIDLAALFAR